MAEHRSVRFGLLAEADRQIAFDEALQRFRHMRRRLKIIDHSFEAVYRRQILSPLQVISTDLHLLAGEMIPREVQLQPAVARGFAAGTDAYEVVERLKCP